MNVVNNLPHEIKHFTFGKVDNSLDLCFGWNVDVIDIHRRCPNFENGSLVGRNS